MSKFEKAVAHLNNYADKLAGVSLFLMMFLIVANVLLRTIFENSILWAYEYVGFLTSVTVALALGNCAIKGGHIAVSFLIDKLSEKKQAVIESLTSLAMFVFMILFTYYIYKYGLRVMNSGEVSITTRTPFHPFIFLTSAGFLLLSITILLQFAKSFKRMVSK